MAIPREVFCSVLTNLINPLESQQRSLNYPRIIVIAFLCGEISATQRQHVKVFIQTEKPGASMYPSQYGHSTPRLIPQLPA